MRWTDFLEKRLKRALSTPDSLATSSSQTSLELSELLNTRHTLSGRQPSASQRLGSFPGQRIGVKTGEGLEFQDLRQYIAGDDVRHIDWNVTARSAIPYTRLYREEREHTTTVAIDFRPCMFTGSSSLKAVEAGLLAAVTLWQASHIGDRVAAVIVSTCGINASRPMAGKRGVLAAFELMTETYSAVCNDTTASEIPLKELLIWINTQPQRSGSFCLFSGFDKLHLLDEGHAEWEEALAVAALRKNLTVVVVKSSLEKNGVPAGRYHFRQADESVMVHLSKASSNRLKKELDRNYEQLVQQLSDIGIPCIDEASQNDHAEFLACLLASGFF